MFIRKDWSDEEFYKDYKESSIDMQKQIKTHTERHFAFDDISSDMYSMFYKADPKYVDGNIPHGLKLAKQALEQVQACREFTDLRNLTKLDTFASGYATQSMLGTLAKYLPPVGKKSPEEVKADLDSLMELKPTVDPKSQLGKQIAKREEDLQKLDQAIENKNNKADNLQVSEDDLRGIMRQALQTAQQAVQEGLDSLAALGAGMEQGAGKNIGLQEKMAIAQRIQNSAKLKEIMNIAGRMVRVARKKQAEKMTATELSDIELGGDPCRLIGSEMIKFGDSVLEDELLARLVEHKAMQYDLKSKEPQGKGPVVVCVDSSGSMEGTRECASKGIALAMLEIARMQKRDFAFIQFSGPNQVREYVVKAGKCNTMDLLSEMEYFIGGGTCFTTALQACLQEIELNTFKQADVVFITDDEGHLDPKFLDKYHDVKKEKQFNCYGISVGCGDRSLKTFCDDTYSVSDLLNGEEAAYQDRMFKI